MKKCLFCGKELIGKLRHNNKYCSVICQLNYQSQQKIDNWKNGQDSGMKKDGSLSQTIRNYLIKEADNKCQLCGWNKINPKTGLVPLEIHHIDGNYLNNNISNLQVLCPNCHSLTPNFKSLNNSNRERTETRKNFCIDCGKVISYNALRCPQCSGKMKITEKPISREELKKLIRSEPFTKIGEMFNITDNAIRKWCIYYNLPSKKKEIKSYSDEEWLNI